MTMVEFHVLKCSDCEIFQVLQVTKSQKWKCKLCGSKQSIVKVYGRGTGADCRKHVQKLNTLRGELDLVKDKASFHTPMSTTTAQNCSESVKENLASQWTKFMYSSSDDIFEEEDSGPSGRVDGIFVTTDRAQYDIERKAAKIKRKTSFKEDQYSLPPSVMKRHKGSQREMDLEMCVVSSPPSRQGFVSRQQKGDTTVAFTTNSEADASTSSVNMKNTCGHEIPSHQRKVYKVNDTEFVTPDSYSFSSRISKDKCIRSNEKVFSKSKSPDAKTNWHTGTNLSAQSSSKWASFIEDNEGENIESNYEDTDLTFNSCGQLMVCLNNANVSKSL